MGPFVQGDGFYVQGTPPPELTRVCAECEKPCPKASYSNKQWQAKAATRRCRACVERPWNGGSHNHS